METLKLVLLVLLLLPLAFAFPFGLSFFIFLFVRAVNKLIYKGINLSMGMALLVSFLIATAIFLIVDIAVSQTGIESWVRYIIDYIITCLLAYLVIPWLKLLNNYKKPGEPKLVAGPRQRKYNFRLLSIISFCIAAVFFCLLVETFAHDSKSDARKFYSPMLFSFIAMGLMYKRSPEVYKTQLKELGELKAQSFVLFLREFKKETHPFYFGKYLNEFGETRAEIQARYASLNLITANFEIFFSAQFGKQLGHLVGLGNPEELAAHETAKLIYKIGDWQTDLKFLAGCSKCIVMVCNLSDSIRYELSVLKSMNCANKLYFFTRPKRKTLMQKYMGWLSDFAGYVKPVRWNDFQAMLNEVGFSSTITPGYGAVIGFDSKNEAVLLKENCSRPSEYVLVVKEDLSGKNILT